MASVPGQQLYPPPPSRCPRPHRRRREPALGPRPAGTCSRLFSRSVSQGGLSSTICCVIPASPLLPPSLSASPTTFLLAGGLPLPSVLSSLPSPFSFFQAKCSLKNGFLYLTFPPQSANTRLVKEHLLPLPDPQPTLPHLSQLPPERPSQEAVGSPPRETSQKVGCRKHPPSSRRRVWGSSEVDTKPCLLGFSNHFGTEFQGMPQGH